MKALLMIVLNLNHKQPQIQNGRKTHNKGKNSKQNQARENICKSCEKRVKTYNRWFCAGNL